MSANLKTIKALQEEVENAGYRGITAQTLLDTLQSLAKVGGCLNNGGNTDPLTISNGKNRLDSFDRSIDTQGVQDGLADPDDPGSWYQIRAAGAGDYTISASIRFASDTEGEYILSIGGVQADDSNIQSPYVDAVTAPANATVTLNLSGCIIKGLEGGDKLWLDIRGPSGATITTYFGQFGIWR